MKKWLLPLAALSVIIPASAYAVDTVKWKPDAEKRFSVKDLNSDGKISKDEFFYSITRVFQKIDRSADNHISLKEMRAYLKPNKQKHVREAQWNSKINRIFARKDLNKDNVISKDEYLSKRTNNFKEYDQDGDQSISLKEMRSYWDKETNRLEESRKKKDDD